MRMFKYLALFISVIVLLSSCSNENNTLVFELGEKSKIIELEKKEGSQLAYDSLIASNLNVPDLYRGVVDQEMKLFRNKKATLPLKIRYFYTSEDKDVKVLFYQWDRILPQHKASEIDSLMNLDVNNMALYDAKFNEVGEQIIEKFGLPNKGHGSLKQEKFKMLDMWKRQLIWDLDNDYVELNMYWVPKMGYRIYKVFVIYYQK